MSNDLLSKLLFKLHDRYQYMLKAYPKAARRERVRKKWYRKYGGGLTEEIGKENYFLKKISKMDDCAGRTIMLPFIYSEKR